MNSATALLDAGVVHVWWIDLTRAPGANDVLSAAERARSAQFRHARECARWSATRAALRQILACYVGELPGDLRLEQGPDGTPTLATANGHAAALRFSVTHAGKRAAVAVAWRRIGVDLESTHPRWPLQEHLPALVATTCSAAEAAWLQALPGNLRLPAFLQLWTIKEAWLKGMGMGLHRAPRTIEVTIADGCVSVCDLAPDLPVAGWEEWSVYPLDAGPGWVASLAVGGLTPQIIFRHWPMPETERQRSRADAVPDTQEVQAPKALTLALLPARRAPSPQRTGRALGEGVLTSSIVPGGNPTG